MFDLPENQEIAKIGVGIYENGGIVSAVCHGPVGRYIFIIAVLLRTFVSFLKHLS